MASDDEVAAFFNDVPFFNYNSRLNVGNASNNSNVTPTASGDGYDNAVPGETDDNAVPDINDKLNNFGGLSTLLEYLFGLDQTVPELPNTYSGKIITGLTIVDVAFLFIILLFIAIVDDRKISNEKEPIFIPKRPVRGFRKYAVILETGHSPAGGTTSGVFIRLCGRLTKSPAFSLSWTNQSSRQLFWSQNKDIFILSVPHYLGCIDSIELLTDAAGSCPPWFLRSVRVMCLDNHKCWKSKANVWLRGDRKPFSFRTTSISALSTREYVKKVFLQNHSWLNVGKRTLGSSYACVQRCSILWVSIILGMFFAHLLMYKWPYGEEAQFDKTTGLRIPMAVIVRGDDAVSAGVIGALGGAFVGMLLRGLIRLLTSANGWSRVDDKDDFTHLMNPNLLQYTDGAVVIAKRPQYRGPKIPPFPPCVDDDIIKLLDSLSPKQIETVKNIVNSKEYNMEGSATYSNEQSTKRDKFDDVVQRAMKASKKGSSKSITKDKNSLWNTAREGAASLRTKEKIVQGSAGTKDGRISVSGNSDRYTTHKAHALLYTAEGPIVGTDSMTDRTHIPSTDKSLLPDLVLHTSSSSSEEFAEQSSDYEMEPDIKSAKSETKPQVPLVSARFSDTTVPSHVTSLVGYDSLSECESDVECMTQAVKTPSEINQRRRPQKVYDSSPWWDDRHGVYVLAPEAGEEHHQSVNMRYNRTAATETGCCRVTVEATFGEDAILRYLEIENELPPGGVVGIYNIPAVIIGFIAFATAFGLPVYIAFERLPLPDAHALYYLYAVILCLVFHGVVFCTADAVACSLLATMCRRRRVAKAQRYNVSRLDIYKT